MTRNRRRSAVLVIAASSPHSQRSRSLPPPARPSRRNGLIAFQAQTDHGIQIFTVRPNGHDLRQITDVDGDATAPTGRRMAAASPLPSTTVRWRIIDADGSGPQPHRRRPGHVPERSVVHPDGTRLVFGHFDWMGTGLHEVWSMKPDGRTSGASPVQVGQIRTCRPMAGSLSFKDSDVGALWVQNMDGRASSRSRRRSRSPTSTIGRPMGNISCSVTISEPGPTEAVNIAIVRPDGSGTAYTSPTIPAPVIAYVGGYSPDGQWIVFRLVKDGLFTRVSDAARRFGAARHPQLPTFVARNIDWGPATVGTEPIRLGYRGRLSFPGRPQPLTESAQPIARHLARTSGVSG